MLMLLVSPAVAIHLPAWNQGDFAEAVRSVFVSLLVFLLPVPFFYRNIRVYFLLLVPLVLLTPVFLFTTTVFALPPGFALIAFILQTNAREAMEAARPFII